MLYYFTRYIHPIASVYYEFLVKVLAANILPSRVNIINELSKLALLIYSPWMKASRCYVNQVIKGLYQTFSPSSSSPPSSLVISVMTTVLVAVIQFSGKKKLGEKEFGLYHNSRSASLLWEVKTGT